MIKLLSTINTTSLIVLILFLGIQISSFHMWFYYWQFGLNNTYETLQMYPHDVHEVTRHLIEYMRNNLDRDYGLQIMTYVNGQMRYFFSELEIKHMLDVYDLFMYGFIIRNLVLACFIISSAYIIYKKEFKSMFKSLAIGSISTLIFLTVLTLIISINWYRAWHIFHYIFFNNDYWLLNPRVDLLINLVPYPFFFAMTSFIGLFFAVGLIFVAVVSVLVLRKYYRRPNV